MDTTPLRLPTVAPAEVEVEKRADGGMILRSPTPLADYAVSVGEYLHRWASETPDAIYLADRIEPTEPWLTLTYGDALARVRSIAQALLQRDLNAERPVMIISDNSIENGLLQLAAMHAGIPVVPVSPAYSLMSQDYGKLKYISELVTPGLVFAEDGAAFGPALRAVEFGDAEIVLVRNVGEMDRATAFAELQTEVPGDDVDAAYAKVGPDTIAKILFTSGSTGQPKGVINTHRMICSNQQALVQIWPFIAERPPVICDWLPWNHTYGGNHNFNLILANGGTLYIDRGKPAPGLIEKSIANLREVSSTIYFNVPRGFDMVIPYLEAEEALRDGFFAELDMIEYAAAALPRTTWTKLEELAVRSRGERVFLTAGWGSTETAPMATCVHFPNDDAAVIGLPAPDTDIKLVPNGEKLEIRVRGPNVTPGYWRRDDLTAKAFDDEGFYLIEDAGRLADPAHPEKGLVFDGRVTEDFKLTTGTWVHVGSLRVAVISAAPNLIQDAVVTGHGRNDVGLLIFPNLPGCRALTEENDAELEDLVDTADVRHALIDRLQRFNAENPGSSTRIARVLFLRTPPRIDANEITDKGYINQRAVLSERAAIVDALYSGDPQVIPID